MYERRDILFELSELRDILCDMAPPPHEALAASTLLMALDGDAFDSAPQRLRADLLEWLPQYQLGFVRSSIMLRAHNNSGAGGFPFAFLIDRFRLRDHLVRHCVKRRIYLPQTVEKHVIVTDIYVGLRMKLPDADRQ